VKRRIRSLMVKFAVAFILWAAAVHGQEARVVRGTVKDQHGQILVGAVVQLENNTTLQFRSYITQTDGAYHFDGLSTSVDYELHARYSGATSKEYSLSKFDSHLHDTIDLTVHVPHHR
jgi:hypothetical protein